MKHWIGVAATVCAGTVGCSVLLVGGCSSSSESPAQNPAAGSSSPASRAPSAIATGSVAAPADSDRSSTAATVKPPKGFGNAQGRVLWNEKGAAGIEVRLCQDISFINGCTGKTYAAKTDADGNYTIDKVPPGEYGLAVRVFNTDSFIYPTSGVLTAAKQNIEAGKTLNIRATNLFKTDLQTLSPRVGETVKTGLPRLAWKPYAGATSYEVVLDNAGGGQSQTLKSTEASVVPEGALLNGAYTWKVTAQNANGIKIAQTNNAVPFKVVGQKGSATVILSSPKAQATVAGSGLTFQWEAHPLADGYQIYLNPVAGGGAILSFEAVQGTSYTLSQALKPGQYFWSITAVRGGQKIAASALQSFHVK